MSVLKSDRRNSKRIMFTPNDGVIGVFSPPKNPDKKIKANIVNISSGGVHISFNAMIKHNIKEGDKLVLTAINGRDHQNYIVNVDTEIKWISDEKLQKEVGAGGKFADDERVTNFRFNELMEYWYMQHYDS